jgi:Holliday junction resolvase-like predicted endonuclease
VKLRDPEDPLSDEAVTPQKQVRLRGAAAAWLLAHGAAPDAAFLVAFVDLDGSIRWVDDAFDGGF